MRPSSGTETGETPKEDHLAGCVYARAITDHEPQPSEQRLRGRAERELARAARAGATADKLENRLADELVEPRLTRVYRSGMARHREAAARHRAVARLYTALADIQAARVGDDVGWGAALLRAVGTVAGASGAVLSVPTSGVADAVLASDVPARAAHEVEFASGEGPAHDCATRASVAVAGTKLRARWPVYGSSVNALGVHSVVAAAVPIGRTRAALVLYDPEPCEDLRTLSATARFLAGVMPHVGWIDPAFGAVTADEFDQRQLLHQAAGLLSAQFECDPDDAVSLLRARAFAEGVDVREIAQDAVRGSRRFEPPN